MNRKISMSQAINEAMAMAMRKDENVILMGEDVAGGAEVDHLQDDEAWGGVLGVTKGLVQEFGRDRILDTPIAGSRIYGSGHGSRFDRLTTDCRVNVQRFHWQLFG
ncbi:hypothetical protein KEH51_29630 [[Brevibacterium] frigoritolerans]|uniref:Transketolase-like pyrimidine-binding domain-containing protein n=1 Tax=Peribacillus frigoritolerans TaxID=450367 RepID=A0A941FTI4_9BACI|nr:hypothetical protein [Peribacillus frigoritolerans]